MFGSRCQPLLSVVAALSAFCLWPRSLAAQETGGSAPISPPRVVERKNPPDPSSPSAKALLEQNQKAIQKDVERLFDLATQLKTEAEKTQSTDVLSLPLVKKAEEIERLAKKIKKHAQALML
jgi:hypothetical protein